MTRLANIREMTTDDIVECSYAAMAIVDLCAFVLDEHEDRPRPNGLPCALRLASELMGAVHDTLETNEGVLRPFQCVARETSA